MELVPPVPAAGANFGYTMAVGKLGSLIDATDDVAVTAIHESSGAIANVGKSYFYDGNALAHHSVFDHPPATPEKDLEFGFLSTVIGDVRGTVSAPATNLVFVSAAKRDSADPACSRPDVGAVDVFDPTIGTGSDLVLSIEPPPDPGETSVCAPTYRVGDFGFSIALGDIDGDTYQDVIVGAPSSQDTVNGVLDDHGRVYIFFGHADFLNPTPALGYRKRWLVLRAPQMPASAPASAQFGVSGGFGISVASTNIRPVSWPPPLPFGGGPWELVVGRFERFTPSPNPGRAHVFDGQWLAAHAPASGGAVVTPSAPPDIDSGVADEYETLIDPLGKDGDWYGWIVFAYPRSRDLGGPGFGGSNAAADIAVHSEGSDYVGAGGTLTTTCGALFVYFADNVLSNHSIVDQANPVKLQTPLNSGLTPRRLGRFGRAATPILWEDTAGVPFTGFLVSEPDRADGSTVMGGAVFLFRAPLDAVYAGGASGKDNAWGTFVLREPADSVPEDSTSAAHDLAIAGNLAPQTSAIFGGWILAGEYDPNSESEQFIVSARGRAFTVGGVTAPEVGQVYSFRRVEAPGP